MVPPLTVKLDGDVYVVARALGPDRAIIHYDGLFVFVDRDERGAWELSGDPPRGEEERAALAELVAPGLDVTEVTVTPPETKR